MRIGGGLDNAKPPGLAARPLEGAIKFPGDVLGQQDVGGLATI